MDQEHVILYMEILRRGATEMSRLEGGCTYIHIDRYQPEIIEMLNSRQWKVDGSVFVLLRKGTLKIVLNTEELILTGPEAIGIPHAALVAVKECSEDVDVYLLSYTPAFLQEVNISFSAISGEALAGRGDRTLEMTDEQVAYLLRYFDLIHTVMSKYLNLQLARHTVSNLTSALFYQMIELVYKQLAEKSTPAKGPQRQINYVHDFIKLVHMYFSRERTVSFYAQKLFISPKYLSMLVKEATGRSASQWIDQQVIVEAKNMLRYSGKNIQQVAYALNFSNQSSFGKYFKHLTGMSPTDYQKS